MEPIELDVIVSVKDRSTVLRCISTLLQQIELAEGIRLGQILLCDGGSGDANCQQQVHQVAQFPGVQVLPRPHPGFNKGWLLNQGLEAATAPLVLISDVDILWNAATLKALSAAAVSQADCLYCLQSVQESDPSNVAIQRPRYTYRLGRTPSDTLVEIYAASPSHSHRPGYGLLCGQRSLFQRVGGYRHCFQGWGWEDRDLLLRSQLLGYTVAELGTVTHLSHGDPQRNAFDSHCTPQQSRDRNILICLEALTQGKLLGDLPQPQPTALDSVHDPFPGSIRVRYPPQLAYATDIDYPVSRSHQPPD